MADERRVLYYHRLANAGSYWGVEVCNEIILQQIHVKSCSKTDKIITKRRMFKAKKETQIKEKMEIYSLSLPIYFRWLFRKSVLSILMVPICASLLYVPLHFLESKIERNNPYFEPINEFVLTQEYIDSVLDRAPPPEDISAPTPPMGVRVTR